MNKNCEKCGANYAPYKIGLEEDAGSFWCELSNPKNETKGICQFCNPQSIYYIKK